MVLPRIEHGGEFREVRPWWHYAIGAVAWTALIFALFLLAVLLIPPIDGWSRSDQLSLFQSATAVAGFGAAAAAIILAASGPARPHGIPNVELYAATDRIATPHAGELFIFLRPGADGAIGAEIPIEVVNGGRAVPIAWQLEVTTSSHVDVTALTPNGVAFPQHKRAVISGDRPLYTWATSVLAVCVLQLTEEGKSSLLLDSPSGERSIPFLEGFDANRTVTFTIRTDLGEKAWTYPVNIAPH